MRSRLFAATLVLVTAAFLSTTTLRTTARADDDKRVRVGKSDESAKSKPAKSKPAKSKPAKSKPAKSSAPDPIGDDAAADAPKPISVALLAGYGHGFDLPLDINPFGIGFGVRGGYNFDALYVGARFMFFLGESKELVGAEVSANAITLGLEAGYDLSLYRDVLFFRPELGVGLVVAAAEAMAAGVAGQPGDSIDDSSEDVYIAPGFALFVRVGERSFLGMDVQLPIISVDDPVVELTILGTAGMRF